MTLSTLDRGKSQKGPETFFDPAIVGSSIGNAAPKSTGAAAARWVVIADKRMSDTQRGVMSTPWKDQFALIVIAAGIGGFLLLRVLRRLLLKWALRDAHIGKNKASLLILKTLGGKKPPLFEFQDLLPELTIPSVEHSLKAWLESVEPLCTPAQFEEAKSAAKEFEGSQQAATLQAVLKSRQAKLTNWLGGWWVEFAYLRTRAPLPTGSNFFSTDQYENMLGECCESNQVKRAAGMIAGHLDFKLRTDNLEQVPQRIGGVVPVCMEGFPLVHGTTRIPGEEKDELRTHIVPADGDAHVLLMVGSAMYKLPVQVGGKRVAVEALEDAMTDAMRRANEAKASKWGKGQYAEPNVSLLTSRERTAWARNRAELLAGSEQNKEMMEIVEQALFCVVLVDMPSGCPENNLPLIRTSFHGDGTRLWYDKCCSILVFSDGRVAWHYEHTCADAPVLTLAVEHALVASNERCKHLRVYPEPKGKKYAGNIEASLIKWETDCAPWLDQTLKAAKKEADLLFSGIAVAPVRFYNFGINDIKTFKVSPDGFIQAALQVASYVYFGRHVLTYESASLRAFKSGRTETIRSATMLMTNFAKAFCDASKVRGEMDVVTKEKLVKMLRAATSRHSEISKACGQGKGSDRHLMGLKLAALTTGQPLPRIFSTYAYNLEFELATSQTPILQEHMKAAVTMLTQGGGFAPTADPGVGVSYHPQRDRIYSHVSVRSKNPEKDLKRFTTAFEDAMTNMRALF